MATWRCRHCATLQDESSRCFICGRAATSCASCVKFRPSLVGGVGYCSVDRRREPLTGAEQRPCWTGPAEAAIEGIFGAAPAAAARRPDDDRGLIEVTRS